VLYELTDKDSKSKGFVIAEQGECANQQTLRWLLLDGFENPVEQEVWVHRFVPAAGMTAPTTAAEFAEFARKMFDAKTSTYVKSYAETHRILRKVSGGTGYRSVIPVPWPDARPAPKPQGELRKAASTAQAAAAPAAAVAAAPVAGDGGSYEQLDDGTIGIRPGGITPSPGPGYLDPALLLQKGNLGMAMAGPIEKSNVEFWLLGGELLKTGLDNTTLGPYRVIGGAIATTPIADWAVVVVSSSYYPNAVPDAY